MEEMDTIITLIGSEVATEGYEFIFRGGATECRTCRLKNACLNLHEGSKYRVVRLRDAPVHDCPLHEGGVKAVEVVEAPFLVAIESRKAFAGSKVVYTPVECGENGCSMYELCHPMGLDEGDKCTITRVVGNMPESCPKGISLKLVELER
ncbi:MAG: UPF0179 family protein [Methermicoccaceae archaeon]